MAIETGRHEAIETKGRMTSGSQISATTDCGAATTESRGSARTENRVRGAIGALLLLAALAATGRADEGMWLPNNPPLAQLKQSYQFTPPAGWLDRLQRACVRMDASGSIVSGDGLVMTNHHVGLEQLQKLSTAERNLLRDGFYAPTRDLELPCPGFEVQVLRSIEDVTDDIRSAVPSGADPAAAWAAMRAATGRIESAAETKTGLDCEVVSLYQGARFHLYRYDRYDDVRLVMAPEEAAANFGGDTDNFEYPRFAYDICFFRLYRDGKAVPTPDHLRFAGQGVKEGDLVFALGHPYRTNRLFTVDQLRFARDVQLPSNLSFAWRRETQLAAFSAREHENARVAESDFLNIQNWRKSDAGTLEALLDPAFMRGREVEEESLRAFVAADPDRRAASGGAWDEVRGALRSYREIFTRHELLGSPGRVLDSDLFRYAHALVGLAEEMPKPSEERLEEFRDSNLESVNLALDTSVPISDALEVDRLASGLSLLCERLGADDSLVVAVLAGLSPRDRAGQLVRGCLLRGAAERRALAMHGAEGVAASGDPMIRLAAILLPAERAMRKGHEDRVRGPLQAAHEKIAAARFAWRGEQIPPDATNTLRLSYGRVAGYEEAGRPVPAFTTFDGLFARAATHSNTAPFAPPPSWAGRRDRLNPDTPYNFLSTLDSVGGNSGSPVLNTRGEVVGLIFDGNLASCVWDYAYEETRARCIALDARAIVEALRTVYGADALVKEMSGR